MIPDQRQLNNCSRVSLFFSHTLEVYMSVVSAKIAFIMFNILVVNKRRLTFENVHLSQQSCHSYG